MFYYVVCMVIVLIGAAIWTSVGKWLSNVFNLSESDGNFLVLKILFCIVAGFIWYRTHGAAEITGNFHLRSIYHSAYLILLCMFIGNMCTYNNRFVPYLFGHFFFNAFTLCFVTAFVFFLFVLGLQWMTMISHHLNEIPGDWLWANVDVTADLQRSTSTNIVFVRDPNGWKAYGDIHIKMVMAYVGMTFILIMGKAFGKSN